MYLVHFYKQGRKWIGRLPFESDLLQALEQFAAEQQIRVGRVEVIGAVKKAAIGFYHQEKKEYFTLEFNQTMEILNCTGNLSLKDGLPKAHLHITLSDHEGRSFGGHLMPGTVIFAGEVVIEEFVGPELHRGFDQQTGLPLWEKKDS
jgi:predicted DNA-binding protein with PD1-like motif